MDASPPHLAQLPTACIVRVCRWLAATAPADPQSESAAGKRCSIFNLLVSSRELHKAISSSWPELLKMLLFETRLGPGAVRPLPPHLEYNYHHNLAPRRSRNRDPATAEAQDGSSAAAEPQLSAQDEEEQRKKDEQHRNRVIIRTYFAAIAYEHLIAELGRQRRKPPSAVRCSLRADFTHRASYLHFEVFFTRLPTLPPIIFRQPLATTWIVVSMALRGAPPLPVTSLAMDLPNQALKKSHNFGGSPTSPTWFQPLKGRLEQAMEEALDEEHNMLSWWCETLHQILYADQIQAEEARQANKPPKNEGEDDKWGELSSLMLRMVPPVEKLDALNVLSWLCRPAVGEADEEDTNEDRNGVLLHGIAHGPHRPDEEFTPEARQLKKKRMLPYREDPNASSQNSCMGNLRPLPRSELDVLKPTRDDFLYEKSFVAFIENSFGTILGWRVREKQDITEHSDSDSSAFSSEAEEDEDVEDPMSEDDTRPTD